jgi:hypothetical protein
VIAGIGSQRRAKLSTFRLLLFRHGTKNWTRI